MKTALSRQLSAVSLVAVLVTGCASTSQGGLDQSKALYEEGRYELAIAKLTQIIKSDPQNAEAHYLRASADLLLIQRDGAVRDDRIKAILADLDRAIELAPDEYWYYYSRAMALAVMARYREAVHDLLVCVQSKDRTLNARAHRRIAQIYDEKFEDMQGPALRHYETYLQMGGDDPKAGFRASELKKLELERPADESREETQLRELEQARSLEAKGAFAEAVEILAKIIAQPELAENKLKEARELYVRARVAQEAQSKAEALYETAVSMIRDGKFALAKGVLEEVIDKYPTTEAARTKAPILLQRLINRENP